MATTASTPTDSPVASATGNVALAFAQCMRAHGLPNFPDPGSGGVFDKSKLQQMGYSTSQLRAVQDGPCKTLLPTTASPTPIQTISVQQQQDYISAAACMRSHGIANFPDPIFSNGSVTFVAPPGLDNRLSGIHPGPGHVQEAHPRRTAVQRVRTMTHIKVLARRGTRPPASSVQWWFVG